MAALKRPDFYLAGIKVLTCFLNNPYDTTIFNMVCLERNSINECFFYPQFSLAFILIYLLGLREATPPFGINVFLYTFVSDLTFYVTVQEYG
jgi:hypothetical protein